MRVRRGRLGREGAIIEGDDQGIFGGVWRGGAVEWLAGQQPPKVDRALNETESCGDPFTMFTQCYLACNVKCAIMKMMFQFCLHKTCSRKARGSLQDVVVVFFSVQVSLLLCHVCYPPFTPKLLLCAEESSRRMIVMDKLHFLQIFRFYM